MNENCLLKNRYVIRCNLNDLHAPLKVLECTVKLYTTSKKKTDQILFSPSPQQSANKHINLADKFNVILCYLATSVSRVCKWNCSWIQNIT